MPAVLREDGFNIIIWTRDHNPMHVHCFQGKPGKSPCVELYLADASIKEILGLSAKDVRRAQKIVVENRDFLINRMATY